MQAQEKIPSNQMKNGKLSENCIIFEAKMLELRLILRVNYVLHNVSYSFRLSLFFGA